ncbi:MAG: lipoprotein-releasing ABC transporter permease subunit [Nitrospirales bacterium]
MTVRLPYEIFVGLRYLRAKRRKRTISLSTFVSVAGITLGVAALIGTLGIMTGFKEDLQAKILGTTSHIIVQDRIKENMASYDEVLARVVGVPRVLAATPFVYRQVLLTSESGVQGIVLRGIDPIREADVTELGNNITKGTLADLNTKELPAPAPGQGDPASLTPTPVHRGVILGKELARRLNAFLGDTVNVVSAVGPVRAVSIVPKIRTFKVVGVFESGMYEYDSSFAYISLTEAQKFFNMGNTVTGIEVKVDDIFKADGIARTIEDTLGMSFSARDWKRMHRNLFTALETEKVVMGVLLTFITIVAAFNIVGALTMIVSQKQREIAILKAMGATPMSIMSIFMLNGLIIGLTGTVIGVPLGYTALWLIQTFYAFDPTIYYIERVPVDVRALDVAIVSALAILISVLATLYPSWQAAKLDPAAALRYE